MGITHIEARGKARRLACLCERQCQWREKRQNFMSSKSQQPQIVNGAVLKIVQKLG